MSFFGHQYTTVREKPRKKNRTFIARKSIPASLCGQSCCAFAFHSRAMLPGNLSASIRRKRNRLVPCFDEQATQAGACNSMFPCVSAARIISNHRAPRYGVHRDIHNADQTIWHRDAGVFPSNHDAKPSRPVPNPRSRRSRRNPVRVARPPAHPPGQAAADPLHPLPSSCLPRPALRLAADRCDTRCVHGRRTPSARTRRRRSPTLALIVSYS